ncbi:Ulp1-like peptidase [Cucumis melo var. makuwa]|uniref:Ulp1-like peptidase n=1 Tax=Cucumis melo var. makuwa TaxID=1194695 RepID=A0A5D3CHG7_CUCMM|nr:Ulp1-like peptidase [Cucumis melo var. makuwa]TYK10634.1 Ulp1-like peptidase [Cucumis melo var. makuwa]
MVFNGQLIHHFLLRKDKQLQFDMDVLGRVDDEEVFKNFDCSTFFDTRLINNLKTILQGKKEAYELKKARSLKAVGYYNIKAYVLAFQVWAYETLSTASEHLATNMQSPNNLKEMNGIRKIRRRERLDRGRDRLRHQEAGRRDSKLDARIMCNQ